MKFSNIYSLLSEAKIDDKLSSSNLPDEDKENIRKVNDLLDNKTKYVDWLLKTLPNITQSPSQTAEILNWFEKNSTREDIKEKDILKHSYADLVSLHRELKDKPTKTQQKEQSKQDAVKIYEDSQYLVIEPRSYEAAVKYGKGTKWCISSTSTDEHWEEYYNYKHVQFYFILNKKESTDNSLYKVAVAINYDKYIEVWDARDDSIDSHLYLISIPNEIRLKLQYTRKIEMDAEERMIRVLCPDANRLRKTSVGWEVKGDILIDAEEVTDIIGTYKLIENGKLTFKLSEVIGELELIGLKTLTSLEGCPEAVNGNFIVNDCGISNLNNGPTSVGGLVIAHCLNLTSIEGCPAIIHNQIILGLNPKLTSIEPLNRSMFKKVKKIDVSENDLTSLDGCPREVKFFDCQKNPRLGNLRGAPNAKERFYCQECGLTTLEGNPTAKTEIFDCSSNNLTNLKGAPREVDQFNGLLNNLETLEGSLVVANISLFVNHQKNEKTFSKEDVKNAGISVGIIG